MTSLSALRARDEGAEMQRARAQALSQQFEPGQLDAVLQEKRKAHQVLDAEYATSSASLKALLAEATTALQDLRHRAQSTKTSYLELEDQLLDHRDLLISPISSKSTNDASSGGPPRLTFMESLQAKHARIKELEQAKDLFSRLAKAEELRLIAKEQVKLPTSREAIDTYRELVALAQQVAGLDTRNDEPLHVAPFVTELARITWNDLYKALESKLSATLEGISWPNKKVETDSLDYEYDAKAKAFRNAFVDLLKLEDAGDKHPLPSNLEQQERSSDLQEQGCLAIKALAQPLVLRFRYHFDSKRQTNRLDKPEWYFANILNAISDHASFVRQDIQKLLDENGAKSVDAMNDFITALLRPVKRKIKASVPQLLDLPSVLAHTIYQALQFDEALRESFGYDPKVGPKDWKGTADLILGNQAWFQGWKNAIKKFIDDKYYEVISSTDAWHINEDYAAANSGVLRPTNSALRIRDLFDQVTDRYRPLPSFLYRLPFLTDIQLPLLESYLQRISSATDAFENLSFGLMRAVPGSLTGDNSAKTRLTNGVNGLQRLIRAGVSATWMGSICKEWSEDVFFLDLWQVIRETSVVDAEVRSACSKLLNHSVKRTLGSESGIFDLFISGFQELSERIEGLMVKHVVKEVSNELKSYFARRWDASFESSGEDEISPDLISPITIFSALLSALAAALPPITINRLYRQICGQLQDSIITRVVLPKVWSEKGGKQFMFDVQYGWVAAAKEATAAKVRRPENGLRRLLDAARLVSLPASTSQGTGVSLNPPENEVTPISKVVQATWDDTNDSAFLECMEKIGVKELLGRKEVKAILRKRPECWR